MPVEFSDLVLTDFSGGLNLRDSTPTLDQTELADVMNFIVTDTGRLRSRPALFPLLPIYETGAVESIFHWNQIGSTNDFLFYVTSAGDLRGMRIGPVYDQGGTDSDRRFRRHFVNMLVGDDSDFENDVGGWVASNANLTVTRDVSTTHNGSAGSMKLTYSTTSSGSADLYTSGTYSSAPRKQTSSYQGVGISGAWVYAPSTNTGPQLVTLIIYQYDSGGTLVGTDTEQFDLSLTEDQWVWLAKTEVIASTTAYMRVSIRLDTQGSTDVLYVDEYMLSVVESMSSVYSPQSFYSTRGRIDDPSINIGTLGVGEIPGLAWTVFNDVLYVTSNGYSSDEVWKFDGSTWTQITDQNLNGTGNEFPFAKFLVNKHERVFAFNVDHSAGPHRSRLWYSEPGDPVTWGSLSWIDVDPDDGSEITGAVSFADGIVIFKDHSVFYLSGVDENSFTLFPVQQGIGCQSPNTIQVVENQVIWFDATRGWFAFDGANILPISDKISSRVLQELYWDPESVKHAASFVHQNQYYCSVPINVTEAFKGAPESSQNQVTYSLNIRNGAWSQHSFGFRFGLNIDGLVYFGSLTNVGLDVSNTVDPGIWYYNTKTSADWRCTHVASTTSFPSMRPTHYFNTGLIKPNSGLDSHRFLSAFATLSGDPAMSRTYAAFDSEQHWLWQSDATTTYNNGFDNTRRQTRTTGVRPTWRGYINWLPYWMSTYVSSSYYNTETNCSTVNYTSDYETDPRSLRITRTGTGTLDVTAAWGTPLSSDAVLQVPGWVLDDNTQYLLYYLDFSYKVLAGTASNIYFRMNWYDEEWTLVGTQSLTEPTQYSTSWTRANWNDASLVEASLPFQGSRYKTYLGTPEFYIPSASEGFDLLVDSLWWSPIMYEAKGVQTFNSLRIGFSTCDLGNGNDWYAPVTVDSIGARYAVRRGPRNRYNSIQQEE